MLFLSPILILLYIVLLSKLNTSPFNIIKSKAELASGYRIEFSAIPYTLIVISEYTQVSSFNFLISCMFFNSFGFFKLILSFLILSVISLLIRTLLPNAIFTSIITFN